MAAAQKRASASQQQQRDAGGDDGEAHTEGVEGSGAALTADEVGSAPSSGANDPFDVDALLAQAGINWEGGQQGTATTQRGSSSGSQSVVPAVDTAALEQVFSRLRASEAERAGLEAENRALAARVGELTDALSASQGAVEKLRGLVEAVGRIRSGPGLPGTTNRMPP